MSTIGEVRAEVSRIADDLPLAAVAGAADEIETRCLVISERVRGTGSSDAEQAVAQLTEAVAKLRDVVNALDGVDRLCRVYAARI